MTLQYVTLTLDVYDGQGNPMTKGTATFTPSVQLTDATDHELITQLPIVASFQVSGSLPTVKLLATDNGAPLPLGWGWTVTFDGASAPAGFSFFLPYSNGASQYLSALSPVSTAVTQYPQNFPVLYPSGSGATDTANVQAALTAASGGTVWLAEGTWGPFTATLSPPVSAGLLPGCCLRGAGWGTILQFDQSVISTLFAMAGTTQGKFDIRDLRIQQSGAADGGTAINCSYFVNSVIDNVSIDKGTGGFHCNIGIIGASLGTEYNLISNCRVSVAGTGAMGVAFTTTAISNSVQDLRVVIQASGTTTASGVYLNTHSTRLTHIDVEVGPGNGIFLDSLAHATVIDTPYLEGNNIGIKIASGVYCPVIIGGTIETNTTAQIQDNGAVSPVYASVWENSGSAVVMNLMANPLTTLGDLLYETSAPAPGRLAGNITATKNFLTQTGTGSVSAAPGWGLIAAADLPTLDAITAPAGNVSLNSHKITNLLNGSNAQDGAAFGQIPLVDATAADILQAGTAAVAGSNGKWADSGHVHAHPGRIPADGGLIAWTYDPALTSNTTTIASGVMYLAKVVVRQACTITNLWVYLATGVAGATAGENFLLLYNSTGSTLLGNTATTAIDTPIASNGFITHAMASTYAAAAGVYWIGFLVAGTLSAGALARAGGSTILGPNFETGGSSSAWYQADGTTGLASSTPPSSVASFSNTNAVTICVGCS